MGSGILIWGGRRGTSRADGAPAHEDGPELKREHGRNYPSGIRSVAAPATVSGEPFRDMPLAERPGRREPATTREPGDLPSNRRTATDGVFRWKESARPKGLTRHCGVILSLPPGLIAGGFMDHNHKIAVVPDGLCDLTGEICPQALDFARRMARASASMSDALSDDFALDASVEVADCHRRCILSIAIRHREIAVSREGAPLASAVTGLAMPPAFRAHAHASQARPRRP